MLCYSAILLYYGVWIRAVWVGSIRRSMVDGEAYLELRAAPEPCGGPLRKGIVVRSD